MNLLCSFVIISLLLASTTGIRRWYKPRKCNQPGPVHGNCPALPGLIQRWYYAKNSSTCLKFNSAKCKYNANNFPSCASCINQCVPNIPYPVKYCEARKYAFEA
uniref:Pancreatic trypsin inhibitor n=1 Tax=Rhipicephalus zambeziensis TaxID=60191 RepID=A0A224Y458_9ACAR